MRSLILTVLSLFIFVGCSAKEINTGVDSVTNDIANAFNKSKDNSSK